MKIDSYDFGRIVIDGKRYSSDLVILPQRVAENWWRKEGHLLNIVDLEEVVKEKPEVLIVGTGANGVMKVPEDVKSYLKEKGIELIAVNSFEATGLFNELSSKKRVACALHLTC
jgi:hypothetical protein